MLPRMLRVKLLIYGLLWLMPLIVPAQDFSLCRNITVDNGLPSNGIRSILQDRQGYIWIATFDGLCKYDGHEMTTFRNSPDDRFSLSNNRLNSMTEDKQGNIWVATRYEGVSMYDRKMERFINFSNQKKKPSSLSSNVVWVVHCDHKGRIWVGTWDGGLDLYDPKDSSFIHFTTKNGLNSTNVYSMEEDEANHLWIGTDGDGINCIDLNTLKIKKYDYDSKHRKIKVNCMAYVNNKLWIGTRERGLCCFDPHAQESVWYESRSNPDQTDSKINYTLGANNIVSLFNDGEGRLWVSVEQNGINIINLNTSELKSYVQGKENVGLTSTTYFKFARDRQGNLWLAGGHGIDFLPRSFSNIKSIRYDPSSLNGLSRPYVSRLLEDSKGRIWIGTEKGLDRYDPKTNSFQHFEPGIKDQKTINGENITALYEDRHQNIWIGTFNGGLNKFEEKTQRFRSFSMEDNQTNCISSNTVWCIYEDSKGNFWIGTDSGLDQLDQNTLQFKHYRHSEEDPSSISDNRVTAILEDRRHTLWFGTVQGLNMMDRKTEAFKKYNHQQGDKNGLPSNLIRFIFEDSRGRLWVGSENGGLSLMNRETQRFHTYAEKDGFLSPNMYSIKEDRKGRLWIGTSNGIACFSPNSLRCKVYTEAHGLLSRYFNWGSACQSASGMIVMGNGLGLNLFDPDGIEADGYRPSVLITRLKVNDEELVPNKKINGEIIIKQSIDETKEIELSYQNNNLSIDFSAVYYDHPAAARYAYRLLGYQDDWIAVSDKHRYAVFNSLPPGVFEFQVKAANCDGLWSEKPTTLKIIVSTPFWLRRWFPVLAFFVFAGILIIFYQLKIASNKRKELMLEELITKRTSELRQAYEDVKYQSDYILQQNEEISEQNEEIIKQKEQLEEHRNLLEIKVNERTQELTRAKKELDIAYSLKSAFLQNMSHEIRTPMNAIVGFVGMIVKGRLRPEALAEAYRIIEQNSNNLTKVVDDILYISQLQTGEVLVQFNNCDILPLLNDLLATFSTLKQQESKDFIQLNLEIPKDAEQVIIETDAFALKQILWNLLSNAIKYTEEGSVSFGYRLLGYDSHSTKQRIEFFVKDTGIGIHGTDLNKIYELFRKIDNPDSAKLYRGIGLGLSISEKLVYYMGGEIQVDSQIGKGSTFTVSFPVRR